MADFDQAQSPRLGQPTPVEATSVRMFSGTDIPEAAWAGQIIYRTDTQMLQVYNGTAWEDVVGGTAGLLTYVGPDAPGGSLSTGDLWFDSDDGHKLYRWDGSAWVSVQDAGIQTAIDTANSAATDASTALSTANSAAVLAEQKTMTFVGTTPPTSEAIGDVWFDSDDGYKQYRAASIGATTIASGQWESVRDTGITLAAGKNKIFYASSAPTAEGVGDVWFDTGDGNHLYVWDGSTWADGQDAAIAAAASDAAAAQTTADGKNKVFYVTSAPTATAAGDLWFDTDDGYKPYVWTGSAWSTVRDATIAAAQADATSALSVANGKNKITFASSAPSGATTGDVWYDTTNDNALFQWNGSTWIAAQFGTDAIAAGSIVASLIAANTITAGQMAAHTITANEIAADTITATEIAAGAITATELGANAVTAGKINAGAVQTAALDALAVTADKIATGTITAAQIASRTITAGLLDASLVLASHISIGSSMSLDPVTGLQITLANTGLISLPADGSPAQFLKVILDATQLIVEDNFELRGATNRISGTLNLSSGIDNPTVAPYAATNWANATFSVANTHAGNYRNMVDGTTTWLTAKVGGSGPGAPYREIHSLNKTTGAQAVVATLTSVLGTNQQILDFTKVGTSYYLLVTRWGTGTYFNPMIYVFDASWANTGSWTLPLITGRSPAVITNDGTDLFVGYTSTTSGDYSVQVVKVVTTGNTFRSNLLANPSFETFGEAGWTAGANTLLLRSNTVTPQAGTYTGRLESTAQRTNLVTNPSFEVNTTGWTNSAWTGYTDTMRTNAAGAVAGSQALRAWYSGAGTSGNMVVEQDVPSTTVVTGGQTYTFSFYMRSQASMAIDFDWAYEWYDASNNYISSTTLPQTTGIISGIWNRFSATGTAPSNAVRMGFYLRPKRAVAPFLGNTDYVYFDAFMVEQGSTLGTYFDGDTGTGYYWTGTSGGSTSVYQPATNVSVTSSLMSITAAQTYTASIYTRGTTARNVVVGINYYDGSSNLLDTYLSTAAANTTTGMTRFSKTGTASASEVQASVTVTINGVTRGEYQYLDAALFEQSGSAGAYFDGSTTASGKIYTWSGTTDNSASYEGTGTSQFTTASSGALGAAPQQMWVGTADLGSKHFAISDNAGTKLWDSTGTRGSTQTAREWGLPGGYPTQGLYYDGTNFQSLESHDGGTGMVAYVYPLSKLATSRQMAARYSQYDSVGVTHETAWSPSSSVITVNPRQYFWVSSSAPQGTGGAEEPNRIRHYIQLDGAGSYYRQADVTASPWQAYYDTPSTAGATAVSTPDFTGFGNPGAVQTAKTNANGPYVQIRGDGFWRFFTMIGTIWPWAGIGLLTTDVPAGFRLCDGSSLLRATYPDLATMLGFAPGDTTTSLSSYWGAADTTHFNLPDLRGKTLFGYSTASQFNAINNSSRGALDHTHNGVDHLHGTATLSANSAGFSYPTGVGYASGTNQGTSRGAMDGHVHGISHNHGSTGAADRSLVTSGTSTANTALPPYAVVQYLIYTGVNNQPGGP